jgi:hypothetical protein
VLVELHIDRLENPTVLRRRVPPAIAMDTGFVRPDPQCGHLNLSAVFVAIKSLLLPEAVHWDTAFSFLGRLPQLVLCRFRLDLRWDRN